MKKLFKICLVIFIVFSIGGCKCSKEENPLLGVWWWDDSLGEEYLEFAKENSVTEVYYCSDDFDEDTSKFIKTANNYNIKVYWLDGNYKWLSDSSKLYTKINKYKEYQNMYPNEKFSGIHLDIEPHQDPMFDSNEDELIEDLVVLANNLKRDFSDINFDYDLPFWLDNIIVYDNEEKEAYKYMIDVANRVFLMSYRDSADKVYQVSEEEIEYAKSVNKVLVLGVETKSEEGDNVSFMEEGKKYMYDEIAKIRQLIPSDYGVSIHQIKTWYSLKEE